jgi:hypothetical protein
LAIHSGREHHNRFNLQYQHRVFILIPSTLRTSDFVMCEFISGPGHKVQTADGCNRTNSLVDPFAPPAYSSPLYRGESKVWWLFSDSFTEIDLYIRDNTLVLGVYNLKPCQLHSHSWKSIWPTWPGHVITTAKVPLYATIATSTITIVFTLCHVPGFELTQGKFRSKYNYCRYSCYQHHQHWYCYYN